MRAHVDVDSEVSDLHQEVFVLDAVHVVVAVKPVLKSFEINRDFLGKL